MHPTGGLRVLIKKNAKSSGKTQAMKRLLKGYRAIYARNLLKRQELLLGFVANE